MSKAVGRPPFCVREYFLRSRYIRGISKKQSASSFPKECPSPPRYTCTVYPFVSRLSPAVLRCVSRVSPECHPSVCPLLRVVSPEYLRYIPVVWEGVNCIYLPMEPIGGQRASPSHIESIGAGIWQRNTIYIYVRYRRRYNYTSLVISYTRGFSRSQYIYVHI